MRTPQELLVLLPRDPRRYPHIHEGSAFVASADSMARGPYVSVYYEGNLYGTANTFKDRAVMAGGRCVERYPTVAKMGLNPGDLDRDFHVIGSLRYDPEASVRNKEARSKWFRQPIGTPPSEEPVWDLRIDPNFEEALTIWTGVPKGGMDDTPGL